jgi:hypothetical protein
VDIILLLFTAGTVLDGTLQIPKLQSIRKSLAALAILPTALASGALVMWWPNLFTALILIISLYRLFNDLRIVQARMHNTYLHQATLRTTLLLLGLQAIVGVAWLSWEAWRFDGSIVWIALTGLQVLVAGVLLASTLRRLRHTAWPRGVKRAPGAELPTLTVAIPARNETVDLQACLESLVACDYPKLEILVLDDCSQDRRTPEVIRSFANRGVRFLRGEDPKDTWLAKNQAYDQLAKAASGDYLLFCGVDVRFGTDSLRTIVDTLKARKRDMLCLLPWRNNTAKGFALTQSMRYWWELVPPRRLFQKPPVLSTCWVIAARALKQHGGFAACARTIVPEAYFARQLVRDDKYSFLRADASIGVESAKTAEEQQATAVRVRYPQLHRRPENVCLLTLSTAAFLVVPFVLAIGGSWLSIGVPARLLAIIACVLLTVTYECLILTTRTGTWWFGLIGQPVGTLYDIGLLHYSMWQYELAEIDWKGRNICVPAMHVVPHLPQF